MKRTAKCNSIRGMVLLLLALIVLSASASAAIACPTCKDGMAANDPEHEHMVKGYFYSILFMMGMPYLLITCFGVYMYREVRKARTRDAAKAQLGPAPEKPLAPAAAALAVPNPESFDQEPVDNEVNELVEV
jgi:uncharacterized membrane protein